MARRNTAAARTLAGEGATAPPLKVERSGGKVTVACKLPHGLILRMMKFIEVDEPVMGGGMKTVKRAQQVGEPVVLNGTAAPFGQAPACLVIGGFAMTPNVDADFWREWVKQNHDLDALKNGLLFASENKDEVEGYAKEHRKLRNNVEPLNPDPAAKDPRMTRGIKTLNVKEDLAD